MKTYFHVDRQRRLSYESQLGQQNKLDIPHNPDLVQHLEIVYPNELSAHGCRYLNSYVKSGNGEAAIELIWEYVRRSHFPARPSRLTSTFAWQTLEDAQEFCSEFGATDAKIWRVQAIDGFAANMTLLNIGTTVLRASQFAHAYWTGEA